MVYHYTSTDTLCHLMESIKCSNNKDSFIFRATNMFFMNDPQEFIYGQQILKRVFVMIENELDIDDEHKLSNVWKETEGYEWDMSLLEYLKEFDEVPYAISFSRLEDSLPMWLNYGNKGNGISLGFQDNREQPYRIKIVNNERIPCMSLYTSDVFYHDLPKDSWLYQLLFETIKSYKDDIKNRYENYKEASLKALIQTAAPLIKSKFYENEEEVRIFKSIGFDYGRKYDMIGFRTNAKNHLIPYIGIEVPVNQLKVVRIGPLSDYELTKMAIELMKKKYGLQFDILPSEVKYREY